MASNERQSGGEDPLIDEVRTIRRAICEEFGNDLNKLAEHLRTVEEEYRLRTGRFARVPRQSGGELFSVSSSPASSHE